MATVAPVSVAQGSALLHFSRNGAYGPDGSELLVLDRGEGAYVFDTHGKRYVDALSSLYCAQLGYSYGEEMSGAAAQQLQRLGFNTMWGTAHPAGLELADRLAALAPEGVSKVFFTSGGSESVESAIKIARQYHAFNGQPNRRKAIARKGAYHGVTLGALALTGVPAYKDTFGPPAFPVRHVSSTNPFRSEVQGEALTAKLLKELEDVILEEGPETISLIVAEPVQNAGGCFVPPPGYWQGLRGLADKYGILLHADEVITGFGRLGEWFGSQRYDVSPDLITVAKGLTSAYAPMGAVLVSDKVAAPFYEGGHTLLHGLTFGGHPLCAAIALKNLEIFERDGVLENVRAKEAGLEARLLKLKDEFTVVGDVRGAGFFWALEFVSDDRGTRLTPEQSEALIHGYLPGAMHEAGLIARSDNRVDAVMQIAPPLISDDQVLDEIVEKMHTVLEGAQKTILG